MPKISVIIPAYNEESVIDDCLESLAHQTHSDYEVIVIDDYSVDSTLPKIKVFCERQPQVFSFRFYGKVGPGKARNLASRESTAEILAFMDADCIATPNWLEELDKVYTQTNAGSVGGPHLCPPQSSLFQRRVEDFFQLASGLIDFYKKPRGLTEVSHNPLCNTSYKRKLFLEAGGFREDLFPGEDVAIDFEISSRGHKIFYQPSAVVFHHRPESILQFRKVMRAYGRSQGKLVRDYGVKRTIQYVGIVVLIGLLIILIDVISEGRPLSVAILVGLFFFLRPNSESTASIFINSLEWFNGFIEGLITAHSPPPGSTPKD